MGTVFGWCLQKVDCHAVNLGVFISRHRYMCDALFICLYAFTQICFTFALLYFDAPTVATIFAIAFISIVSIDKLVAAKRSELAEKNASITTDILYQMRRLHEEALLKGELTMQQLEKVSRQGGRRRR